MQRARRVIRLAEFLGQMVIDPSANMKAKSAAMVDEFQKPEKFWAGVEARWQPKEVANPRVQDEDMLHVESKAKIALAEFEKSIRWPGMTVEEALLEASVELHKLYRQGMKELGDVAVQWGKAVYDVWSSEDADKKIVAWYKQFIDGLGG